MIVLASVLWAQVAVSFVLSIQDHIEWLRVWGGWSLWPLFLVAVGVTARVMTQ